MSDWHELVKQRLKGIRLTEQETAEVTEELAEHLESVYLTSRSEGVTEQAAVEQALREVSNWQELRTKIESSREKETPMNKRVTQFWFPSFLTLLLSQVFLMVIQASGPKPYVSPALSGPPRMTPLVVVYLTWFVTLPFIGALGAYLSRRAGGRGATVVSTIAFPVFPFLAFLVVGLPIALLLDDHVAHNITLPALLVGASAWVVFPAIALLAGGLLVRYLFGRCSEARGNANVNA